MDHKTASNTVSPLPDKQAAPRRSVFSDTFADTVGAVVTAASGIGAAIYSIRTNFFKNAHKYKLFDKEMTIRDQARELVHTNATLTGEPLISKIESIEHAYDAAKSATLRREGLDSIGKQWRSLRKHQKNEAMLSFMVGATVALGIVATLLSNRQVSKKQEALEMRLNNHPQLQPQH